MEVRLTSFLYTTIAGCRILHRFGYVNLLVLFNYAVYIKLNILMQRPRRVVEIRFLSSTYPIQ
jgi:hypothetical protein